MPDFAERFADQKMDELRGKIQRIYKQAVKRLKRKLKSFFDSIQKQDAKKREELDSGKISEAEYERFRRTREFHGNEYEKAVDDAAKVYVDADSKVSDLIGGVLALIFAESSNYTAYRIETAIKEEFPFSLRTEQTAGRLKRDGKKLLPEYKINQPKDYVWNDKRLRNAITQGIANGESINQIAKRLMEELATSNEAKMRMFARTAVTAAQNAGRLDRMYEAQDMGIEVQKQWVATMDDRTRELHADLDGQIRNLNEPFEVAGYAIDYPGDPDAAPEMVFNCRCSMVEIIPGYRYRPKRYDQENREVIEDMTYNEWKRQRR